MKLGTAPGFDVIHPECLPNCGKYVVTWLAKFISDIRKTGYVFHLLKRTKIVAIIKSGEFGHMLNNYRPIVL